MRDYKRFTSGRLKRQAEVEGNQTWLNAFREAGKGTGRGEYKVWQDSFWDKILYNERMLRQKLNYMHRNPVRAGLVENPEDYPYSSYRNYVLGDQTLIEIDMDWF
jgi:REP element-mobilizing transposase RayT